VCAWMNAKWGETFLCSISRGDKAATTWGGGHQWCMVTTTSPHMVPCARTGDRCKPLKRPLRLTSGPGSFVIFKLNLTNFEIQISDLHDVQSSPIFAGRQLEIQGATFLFDTTSNSLRISCYKFWSKFKFESSLNFRGVQTFLEKSDKFSKIPSSHGLHKSEFSWVHLYICF
jgi:hypothetical protein